MWNSEETQDLLCEDCWMVLERVTRVLKLQGAHLGFLPFH